MIHLAGFKGEGEPELMAGIKPQPQHLAVFELHILNDGLVELYEAEVTMAEMAVYEFKAGQVKARKVTAQKAAVRIFRPGKRELCEIFFIKTEIVYVCCLHRSEFIL